MAKRQRGKWSTAGLTPFLIVNQSVALNPSRIFPVKIGRIFSQRRRNSHEAVNLDLVPLSSVRVSWVVVSKRDDYVRVHYLDAAEATVFIHEDIFPTGRVLAAAVAHDSSFVSIAALGGSERLLVPNTRMEFVSPRDDAKVTTALGKMRDNVRLESISAFANTSEDSGRLSTPA